MNLSRYLRVRLFLSYLLVIAVGALAALVVTSLLAPSFFQGHLQRMGRGPLGMGAMMAAEIDAAFASSVQTALVVGVGLSVVAAGLMAALAGRRILRPLDHVRQATRKLAAGDYRHRVPVPTEVELAALATDVNILGEALDRTERRRVELIGEVAHELRTPLTTIEGYMEGLIDGMLPATPETFLAVADEASRLKRLADDLSLLSRTEERALALELRNADVAAVVARAAERLRPQFESRGVDLQLVAPGAALPVRVDPDRISQVLTNLLGNALTHTPPGGTVTVTTGARDHTTWVDITDTGRGLHADELDRIFERFYRGTDNEGSVGRGLGLTIARGIARAHGGDIVASSPGPGHGATFRVTLPTASSD
jgi:signal transduction histidine kinase